MTTANLTDSSTFVNVENLDNLKSLGSGNTTYETKYNPKLLEYFENPQQTTPYEIDISAPEFTTTCPKTGQPDFATILIQYWPEKRCLESKSLKLYLGSFRNEGMFHEKCVNIIAKDLYDLLEPWEITVVGQFASRGGISFHPTVTLRKPEQVTSTEWNETFECPPDDKQKNLFKVGGE